MKLCVPVLMMCALAAPPTAFAQEADNAVKVEKSDKSDKKAEKEAGKEKEAPAQDPAAPAQKKDEPRDDEVLDLAEPDFTVVNLPTTLRMPKYKSAFRVTHRFARPLGEGSFGSLAEDFFGLDASAQIGLEFRFGIFPGTQVGI